MYGFEFAWTGCKLFSKLGGRLNRRGLPFPSLGVVRCLVGLCCVVVVCLCFVLLALLVPFGGGLGFFVVGVWCFVGGSVLFLLFLFSLVRLFLLFFSVVVAGRFFSLLVLLFSFLLSLCWFSSLLFGFSSCLVLPSLFLFPVFSFLSFVVFLLCLRS